MSSSRTYALVKLWSRTFVTNIFQSQFQENKIMIRWIAQRLFSRKIYRLVALNGRSNRLGYRRPIHSPEARRERHTHTLLYFFFPQERQVITCCKVESVRSVVVVVWLSPHGAFLLLPLLARPSIFFCFISHQHIHFLIVDCWFSSTSR